MDLSEKLAFYSQNKKFQDNTDEVLSPSVKALKDHFEAEVLFAHSPILKISKSSPFVDYTNKNISINLISKNEFTSPVPRDKCLFFDLETTGLSGGAGTFAFLIGFAYWEGTNLKTEQYFLPDFGREYELFNLLQNWLTSFDYIVSYNGKSYDMPLLSNRFVLNRVDPGFKKMQHVDIIHMCRRVWKKSLPSCSLKSIETLLLKITRTGDIPGEFIPQAYFNFINTGIIHDVIRMVDHNLQDIISLALIFDKLHAISNDFSDLPIDSNALSCLAKIAYETNNHDFYLYFEQKQIVDYPDAFKYWKSLFLKRNNDYKNAHILWQDLLTSTEYYFFSVEEIAKYYEHKKHDITAAKEIVESAFRRFSLEEELEIQAFEPSIKNRFIKRYHRLQQKIDNIEY